MDHGEMANNIQMCINSLERLNIPATESNMRYLLGVFGTLAKVRDELNRDTGVADNG